MYASVRRYQLDNPERLDEVKRQINEGLVPTIRQMPGFVAYYFLNAGYGVVTAVSVFEEQSGVDESTACETTWIRQKFGAFIPNPPTNTAGDVFVSAE